MNKWEERGHAYMDYVFQEYIKHQVDPGLVYGASAMAEMVGIITPAQGRYIRQAATEIYLSRGGKVK